MVKWLHGFKKYLLNRHKVYISFFLLLIICLFSAQYVFAQTETPTPTQAPDNSQAQSDLQKQIREYEQKITQLKGEEKSLSSQISVMDNQIKLTELRLAATEAQIEDLQKDIKITKGKVSNLEKDINTSTKALLTRIAAVYQVGSIKPWEVFLTANNIGDVFKRLTYLRIVQIYDKRKVYAAEQAKNDYNNQKKIFEDKEKEAQALNAKLELYTNQLDQEKSSKKTLLTQTQGSEGNYQKLLAQAKAQLAGFSAFTASQGGASLLSGQTSCDDWGCYYNQRDSSWGGSALNGTQYTLASDGCLVTSMAMVYTYLGHRSVTPQTINSIPSNFASYYPAYLNKTIVADGTSTSRVAASIDSELSSGRPVIVGISYNGGPIADHFVVLVSGSGGNYIMNDPFTPNGKKIPFSDHYSVGSIVEIEKVVVN